jgi:pyruvate dehydrogenase E2 component (dihydrolipoamide acetyltransferase)
VADLTLPELGENITAGDVLRILVKPGDTLAKDQPVLELETDKATIEVPSSLAGHVTEIKVKAGDKVKVGQAILTVEESGGAARPSPAPASPPPASAPAAAPSPQAKTSPRTPPPSSRPSETDPPVRSQDVLAGDTEGSLDQADVDAQKDAAARGRNVVDISRGSRASAEAPAAPEAPPAPAAPSVRRMARELGVDINDVPGSGPDGRISVEDVKAHVSRLVNSAPAAASRTDPGLLQDLGRWGEIERQPMRGVRRKTAEHLSAAWATIPHVTQHDVADITAVEEFRKRYAKQVEAAGGNLTVTAILTRVVASALKVFPQFNASVDMAAEEIVYKKYVHIGIAVDTDRGLLVPVIRDVDRKNITQVAAELSQLSDKARGRKLTLDEMQGGCFSISNLGGIGGTSFTPIINAPEVAILGIARARMEPVYQSNQFVPRLMLPLSLSYDHRVIDGADGIRFLRWIVQALEQPFLLALEG